MPEVYSAFKDGQLFVQLMSRNNPFGRNEADKTTENTLKRDCKTGGGYIGFSANFIATQRWVLNESRRWACFGNCLAQNIYQFHLTRHSCTDQDRFGSCGEGG